MGDLIDRYLIELGADLHVRRNQRERIVAEVAGHLQDSARALETEGVAVPQAERAAIGRFGPAAELADRFNRSSLWVALAGIQGYLVTYAGVGLVTIGGAGIFGWSLAKVFGRDFISGNVPGEVIAPSRCADYLRFHPEAATCNAAAVAHHFDEFVGYHLDALALGVIVLGARWLWRRRDRRVHGRYEGASARPAYVLLALASFGLAALLMLPVAAGTLATGTAFAGSRGGWWLACGVASSAAFLAYAVAAWRYHPANGLTPAD